MVGNFKFILFVIVIVGNCHLHGTALLFSEVNSLSLLSTHTQTLMWLAVGSILCKSVTLSVCLSVYVCVCCGNYSDVSGTVFVMVWVMWQWLRLITNSNQYALGSRILWSGSRDAIKLVLSVYCRRRFISYRTSASGSTVTYISCVA